MIDTETHAVRAPRYIYTNICFNGTKITRRALEHTLPYVRHNKRVATSVSTWMGDHQGRLGAMNLGPLVVVDFNL